MQQFKMKNEPLFYNSLWVFIVIFRLFALMQYGNFLGVNFQKLEEQTSEIV